MVNQMSDDELPVNRKPLKEDKREVVGQKPTEIEAYGGRVEIASVYGPVRITLTTAENAAVVSLPVKAFQDLLRDGEKALREKGLSEKFIGKGRQFNSFTKP
jgi:hypothetical protein